MDEKSYAVLVDACVLMQNMGVNVVPHNPGDNEAAHAKFIFSDDETSHRFTAIVVLADTDARGLLLANPNWPILVTNRQDIALLSAELSARLPRSVRWVSNGGFITLTASSTFFLVVSSIYRD